MGAHFKALDEGVLMASLDHWYTQVGFNHTSVQVCVCNGLSTILATHRNEYGTIKNKNHRMKNRLHLGTLCNNSACLVK